MKAATTKAREIYYPESDGRPMAETDLHRKMMIALLHALEEYFRNTPEVYVAGNLLLYYEKGNPKASCAPDVFLVRGVPKGDRRTYRLWEEGKAPNLVIELTSKSTRQEDTDNKPALYTQLGVEEYFMFDPLNEYLRPPLIGYRLDKGEYVRMEPSTNGRFKSEVTGLELGTLNGWLRFFDPATGLPLRTPAEAEEARRKEEEARRKEEEARRKEQEARRIAEKALADEKEVRKSLEKELERMRSELKRRDSMTS